MLCTCLGRIEVETYHLTFPNIGYNKKNYQKERRVEFCAEIPLMGKMVMKTFQMRIFWMLS